MLRGQETAQERRLSATLTMRLSKSARRADGKELYFIAPDGTVMAAEVISGALLSVGVPRALFRIIGAHGDWDVVLTVLVS